METPITIDGKLEMGEWGGAEPVETWYETSPGNNSVPHVKSRAYLAYDDSSLSAAFEFEDPNPTSIRAPLGDRDSIASDMDYAGLVIDPTNHGRTGLMFFVNARGVQYDAVSDDATGADDVAPDFFWESAARVTASGWSLEIRIPFSSLSYPARSPAWRIMLFRNYSRDFRYQYFTTPLPRDSNCFICHSSLLWGLENLPAGGGLVVAPYVNAAYDARPRTALGSRLKYGPPAATVGVDIKWRPTASTVVDLTVNPDFSQVESDTAQIGANERFALFFPEKRPFFMEGVDLFGSLSSDIANVTSAAAPLQPVYTRTLTDPDWGLRGTSKVGRLAYTGLVVRDSGGGQVIMPGRTSSSVADQDFASWAGVWRLRYELGSSFVGALATIREINGGGFNLVSGPDFQWRPNGSDSVTGQVLFSRTRTPDKPILADEWDGRVLSGPAADVRWKHQATTVDWMAAVREVGSGFRSYNGFVPQVGYRELYAEGG